MTLRANSGTDHGVMYQSQMRRYRRPISHRRGPVVNAERPLHSEASLCQVLFLGVLGAR
jgi:hypothetical protein